MGAQSVPRTKLGTGSKFGHVREKRAGYKQRETVSHCGARANIAEVRCETDCEMDCLHKRDQICVYSERAGSDPKKRWMIMISSREDPRYLLFYKGYRGSHPACRS